MCTPDEDFNYGIVVHFPTMCCETTATLLFIDLITMDPYGAEFSELFQYLVDELKRYTSRETFDKFSSDKVLVGLMTLLSVLLAGHVPYREECGKLGIIEELLNNFLFATGKTDQDKKLNLPKCKTHASRELAYRLVVQCILGVPSNYRIVNMILSALHKTVVHQVHGSIVQRNQSNQSVVL
eukprot:932307_1